MQDIIHKSGMLVKMKKKPTIVFVCVFCLTGLGAMLLGVVAVSHLLRPQRTDRPLTASEKSTVQDAVTLIHQHGLTMQSELAEQLMTKGIWRAATDQDPYLKASEKNGDTPFAYTLSSGKHPRAIVLAPRFFTETTPTARAALMLHEMGHYQAYVRTGRSDEYDGYKAEYDTHTQIGLTEDDSLTYFAMLDGVVEYVIPRDKSYKSRPDVQAYIAESSGN